MNPSRVAVIDIGSNSIKVLVAAREADGSIVSLGHKTLDARISAGIDRANPRLTDEAMARGLAAVRELKAFAETYSPGHYIAVATSAVRDAANGDEFRARIKAETGCDVRILTGDEEAHFIGRGLTCDPALAGLRDFYVFDLGGGSLECLSFRDRELQQAVSFQLGCVRLTEHFVTDWNAALPVDVPAAIARHVGATISSTKFAFDLPSTAVAVGTGGTLTTTRAILGARDGLKLEDTSTTIPVSAMRELLGSLGAMDLATRRSVPGLPAARADVFPTALATLVAVAELGNFTSYHHSLYNLRWGMAAEALEKIS